MPDRTFRDRLTIGRGPDQIDLYYFGRGHTNGDAIVAFPAVRAMHTGDLYAWKAAPLIDPENGGSGVEYPQTLEKAVKGIRNIDTVIPGHAPVTTWAAFVEFAEYAGNLYGTSFAAIEAPLARGQDLLLEVDVQGALPELDEGIERRVLGIGRPVTLPPGMRGVGQVRFDDLHQTGFTDPCFPAYQYYLAHALLHPRPALQEELHLLLPPH